MRLPGGYFGHLQHGVPAQAPHFSHIIQALPLPLHILHSADGHLQHMTQVLHFAHVILQSILQVVHFIAAHLSHEAHILHFMHIMPQLASFLHPAQFIFGHLSQPAHLWSIEHMSLDFMSLLQPVHFIIIEPLSPVAPEDSQPTNAKTTAADSTTRPIALMQASL